MRLIKFILVLCLLIGSAAAEPTLEINIRVSPNNIITQQNTIRLESSEYETVEFQTLDKPLSVVYSGDYEIIQKNDTYAIILPTQGNNEVSFDLLFDSQIDANGKQRTYRSSFTPPINGTVKVSLTLPLGYSLNEKKPNAIPQPQEISTDGRSITLTWTFNDEQSISVFYEGGEEINPLLIVLPLVFSLICIAGVFFYLKKRNRKHVTEMLSTEEHKVIEAVRAGTEKQKEVAIKLDFSKSKMSKIVRRLEEKGLIERTPHFKTNIISLKGKVK
ncbi:MAG: MarR family transcriptional regulator [Nanoarchaeota archaeon]